MAILEIQGQQVDIPDWDSMDEPTRNNTVNEIAGSMQNADRPQQQQPVQQQQQANPLVQPQQQQGGFSTDVPPTDTPVTQMENQLTNYARTGANAVNQANQATSTQQLVRNQINTNEKLRRTNEVQSTTDRIKQQLKVDPVANWDNQKQPSSEEVMTNLINQIRGDNNQAPINRNQPTQPSITSQPLPPLQQGSTGSEELSAVDNGIGVADMLAQGFTFGFSDEIEAAGRSALGNLWEDVKEFATDEKAEYTSYDEALKGSRERIDKFREANPNVSTALEIAGSLPVSVIPVGAAAKAATLVGKAASLAGIGAVEGALSGAGTTTAELGSDRWWDDTGTGGLTGAIVAPVVGIGGEKLVDLISKIPTEATTRLAGGYERLANEEIRTIIDRTGLTEDEAVRTISMMQEQGLKPSMANIEKLGGEIRAINRRTQIDEPLRQELQERADEAVRIVADNFDPKKSGSVVLNRNIDGAEGADGLPLLTQIQVKTSDKNLNADGRINVNQLEKDIIAETDKQATAAYNKAFELNEVRVEDIPNKTRNSAQFQTAYNKATEQITNLNASKGITSAPSETHILDQTQKNLNKMADEATGVDKVTLGNYRRDVNSTLDELSPEYAFAKQIFTEGKKSVEGLRAGSDLSARTLTSADSQEIIDTIANTGSFKEGTTSFGSIMGNRIRAGWRDGKTKKILNEADREKLKQLYATQGKNFDSTVARLNATDNAIRTNNLAQLDVPAYRANWADRFKTKLNNDNSSLITSAMLLVANPSLFALSWGIRKFGESAVARSDVSKLQQAMQKQLFKEVKPDDVRAFFKGEIDDVPADSLKKILSATGVVSANEFTKDEVRQNNQR